MFAYFGAKHRLARSYPAPQYNTIVEPFAGAAGYSCYWMGEYEWLRTILVEKDEAIAELWRQLLGMSSEEIMGLPDIVRGEGHTSLLSSVTKGKQRSPYAMLSGRSPKVTEWEELRWETHKRAVARRRSYMGPDRVRIEIGDYTDAPDIEATWFIDPPYEYQGHGYRMGSSGIDYEQLGEWCRSRRGQVIVTEQEPARWLPFRPHVMNQTITNAKKKELVWLS
jgi:hypothetical protein